MSMRYSDELIKEVSERNDIVEIVSEYVSLKKSGKNYKGLCPFHNEKTPSFIVSEDKQLFHCFGCGQAGDVIKFVMEKENLDFIDALELLAERCNIDLSEYTNNNYNKEKANRKNKLYKINREAAIYFFRNLNKNHNKGIEYLQNRGLSTEIIKKFGLGYSINEWERLNRYLLSKGYSQELIYETGLVVERKDKKGYYDRFRNRVIFPIISTTKKVIGFGGRVLDDSVPKYLNSPESPIFNKGSVLYGLNLARNQLGEEKRLIVVEGYTDVISLYQFGIKNVVATLGTALTKNHANLFKRYCEEVIIAYDSDSAGEAATIRGMDILDEVGCRIKVIRLNSKMDPDEYIRKFGADSFREKIEMSLPLIDYKMEKIKNENNLDTNEGKISFVRESIKIIKPIKSPIKRDVYIEKLSKESGIAVDVIKSEIYGNNSDKKNHYKYNRKNRKSSFRFNKFQNKVQPVKKIEKNGWVEIEKNIISLCLTSKTNYEKIFSKIDEKDFLSKGIKNIFANIVEAYKLEDKIDLISFIDRLEIEETRLLKEIEQCFIPFENIDKTIEDLLNSLKYFKVKNEIEFTKKEMKRLEKTKYEDERNVMKIKELWRKLDLLGKELKSIGENQIDLKGGKSYE
ncbi:DNA primase [Maledivibacter halophilus]|uniref:DNA primase n=1 Tax=Maledivibacter halophilus TaxID=36842 RepID=A0A1T5LUG1_9FIRM|nr:DNA primase [Maledivibacter halophilus]SKC79475.1 DNA primase [Maledivibacter halophilus]